MQSASAPSDAVAAAVTSENANRKRKVAQSELADSPALAFKIPIIYISDDDD